MTKSEKSGHEIKSGIANVEDAIQAEGKLPLIVQKIGFRRLERLKGQKGPPASVFVPSGSALISLPESRTYDQRTHAY